MKGVQKLYGSQEDQKGSKRYNNLVPKSELTQEACKKKIRELRTGVEPLSLWLLVVQMLQLLESFRFEDEDDFWYEIKLKVFSRILEKYSTRKLHSTIFHLKNLCGYFYWRRFSPFPVAK